MGVTLSWVACEILTGRVVEYLPDLEVPSVASVMGTYSTVSNARLPLVNPPADWERAVVGKGSWLVLLVDGEPQWGGTVVRAPRTAADHIEMTLVTPEAYLADRFVGDVTYTGVEQCALLANIVTTWALTGGPSMGVQVTPGTTTRDRTYKDADDRTVLAAISELSQVEGGPEWTIRWEHLTSPERYRPVLVVADRLGSAPAVGMRPVTMEMPGVLRDLRIDEDWATGRGATTVVATTTAQGDDRPQSPAQTASDLFRPAIEYRFTPSTSITDVTTLTRHAASRLAVMRDGATTVSLTCDLDSGPRLGSDWQIGDTLGYVVAEGVAPAWPSGVSGQARAIGWEMGVDPAKPLTMTPILAGEAA